MKEDIIKKEIEDLTILIATAREEGDEDRHREVVNRILELFASQKQEILEKVEKMRLPNKEENYKHKRDFLGKYDNGYNKALDDILELLKQ